MTYMDKSCSRWDAVFLQNEDIKSVKSYFYKVDSGQLTDFLKKKIPSATNFRGDTKTYTT